MKNIYKRGNQYHVEFMIQRKILCIMKTTNLQEAIKARDDFLKERQTANELLITGQRASMLKIYEECLIDGLNNREYNKIKMAMNFLSQDEFDSAVKKLKVIDKKGN